MRLAVWVMELKIFASGNEFVAPLLTCGFVYSIVQRYIIQNNLQNIEYTPEEIEAMMNDANEFELAHVREYAERLARGDA